MVGKPLTDHNPAEGNDVTQGEIRQQPAVWRSFAEDLERRSQEIRAWLAQRRHDEIWFCGAGTSAFIGDALSLFLNAATRSARFRSVPSTDFVACPRAYLRPGLRLLVVSFGRSGNSSESIGTLDLLDALAPFADRLHITCNASSILATRPMPEGAEGVRQRLILPAQTEDQGFAMTSSYTTMFLSALACFDPAPPAPVSDLMRRLADAGEKIIAAGFQTLGALEPPSRAVFLGAGFLSGVAREAALKVLELTAGQVVTLYDTPLGFRHGPKAFMNEQTHLFLMRSWESHAEHYETDLIAELEAQYGRDCLTVCGPNEDVDVPLIGSSAWSAVLHVLSAQILAYLWSIRLGLSVDDPFGGRRLTRVVSGVRLYPVTVSQTFWGGIDVGGTKIESRLYDDAMNELKRRRVAIHKEDYNSFVDAVTAEVNWLRSECGAPASIGIGLPGIVNPETGAATMANLPTSGRTVTADIAQRVNGNVAFANDCKLFALSEALGGAGEGAGSVCGLIMGTGVGGGLVRSGKIVFGHGGLAGEVGHIAIPSSLGLPIEPCGCGAKGCYETLLAGGGVVRLVRHMTGMSLSAVEVFQRAEQQDQALVPVVQTWFALLGELLHTLHLMVDPEAVVIGGGLSAVPHLATRAREALERRALPRTILPRIATARFGDASGARGAALFARSSV